MHRDHCHIHGDKCHHRSQKHLVVRKDGTSRSFSVSCELQRHCIFGEQPSTDKHQKNVVDPTRPVLVSLIHWFLLANGELQDAGKLGAISYKTFDGCPIGVTEGGVGFEGNDVSHSLQLLG